MSVYRIYEYCIKELEIDNEYKVERFEKVKTEFGPSILCCLEVNLPRRLVSKLDDKVIKDLNKNNNLKLVHKDLKDVKFAMILLKSN